MNRDDEVVDEVAPDSRDVSPAPLDNSHFVSERLVTRRLEDAPSVIPEPETAETSSPRENLWMGSEELRPNITDRRRNTSTLDMEAITGLEAKLTQLRYNTESAELEVRRMTAMTNLKRLTREADELDDKYARSRGSGSASPEIPTQPADFPTHQPTPQGGMSELVVLLRYCQEQRREDQERADRQRREDQERADHGDQRQERADQHRREDQDRADRQRREDDRMGRDYC